MKIFKALSFLFVAIVFSCNSSSTLHTELETLRNAIKKTHAPDKRVELFNIAFLTSNNHVSINGETTSKKALKTLLDQLQKDEIAFTNNVRVLPDSAVGKKIYALANNSVINIRSNPKHSAELGTQGLLGMQLLVLDKKESWYRVQTPDKYISWVDAGGITLMNVNELFEWNKKEKIIYTTNNGYVYKSSTNETAKVSDISFGGKLALIKELDNHYKVAYPDKRIGYLKKSEATLYKSWLQNNPSNASFIESSAKSMLGVPYLWGGTSTKGNDCSGFTKTVYLMNGFVIPRDASQQVHAGKIVDENLKFEGLKKGDLMFFGTPASDTKKMRVTHVGIWLGNNKGEFIHSASNVHLSSINKNEKHYDAFNKGRYLGSRRYLGVTDTKIIDLKKSLEIIP